MIQAVMVICTKGKPLLLKFYNFQPPEKHQDLVRGVFQLLSARPDRVSNFVEANAIFGPPTGADQHAPGYGKALSSRSLTEVFSNKCIIHPRYCLDFFYRDGVFHYGSAMRVISSGILGQSVDTHSSFCEGDEPLGSM